MAQGGASDSDSPPPPPPPPPDPEKVKGFTKGFNGGYDWAEGGEVGVHKQDEHRMEGTSEAGHHAKYRTTDMDRSYSNQKAKEAHHKVLSELQSMPKPNLPMYEGGAVSEDDRMLNQHGEYEEGPQGGGQGFHGESYAGNPGNSADNYQSESHEEDMVGRIMKMRQRMYSEGGRIANADHGEDQANLAGFAPNEFDDLVLRDNLHSSYTGENSGDNLGNAQEDADQQDIVSRIMRSRAKKDRLPNPR